VLRTSLTLKRYLAEFDFRYNERMALGVDDKTRAIKAITASSDDDSWSDV
jgi:hypothetical protein